jgi:hypothetical protein
VSRFFFKKNKVGALLFRKKELQHKDTNSKPIKEMDTKKPKRKGIKNNNTTTRHPSIEGFSVC